jgi:Fe2+ transport system protein FeoA
VFGVSPNTVPHSQLATTRPLTYCAKVNKSPHHDSERPDECSQPFLCPLSAVSAGVDVRIKQLSAPAEVTHRLREMGFCEEQKIKLLSRQTSLICQVCNARLGISKRLAEKIIVEQISRKKVA